MTDLALPTDPTVDDRAKAHATIMAVLEAEGMTYTGGCRAFYTPAEWAARGEEYGLKSILIVVYDGGNLREFFDGMNGDHTLWNVMAKALRDAGFYAEECTCWYSAIYKL